MSAAAAVFPTAAAGDDDGDGDAGMWTSAVAAESIVVQLLLRDYNGSSMQLNRVELGIWL